MFFNVERDRLVGTYTFHMTVCIHLYCIPFLKSRVVSVRPRYGNKAHHLSQLALQRVICDVVCSEKKLSRYVMLLSVKYLLPTMLLLASRPTPTAIYSLYCNLYCNQTSYFLPESKKESFGTADSDAFDGSLASFG